MRKFFLMLGFLILVFGLLSACQKKTRDYNHIPDENEMSEGGIRIDASGGEASNLNPILAADSASSDIVSLVFSGLTRYNPELKLEGDLAESWEVSDSGKKVVFHLKKNVLWQ